MRTKTQTLTYKGYPTLRKLLETREMTISGHGRSPLRVSWGRTQDMVDDQIIVMDIDGNESYVDKQDLLYFLRAIPPGKEAEVEQWEIDKALED